MFGLGCSICWDKDCEHTLEEQKVYRENHKQESKEHRDIPLKPLPEFPGKNFNSFTIKLNVELSEESILTNEPYEGFQLIVTGRDKDVHEVKMVTNNPEEFVSQGNLTKGTRLFKINHVLATEPWHNLQSEIEKIQKRKEQVIIIQ